MLPSRYAWLLDRLEAAENNLNLPLTLGGQRFVYAVNVLLAAYAAKWLSLAIRHHQKFAEREQSVFFSYLTSEDCIINMPGFSQRRTTR